MNHDRTLDEAELGLVSGGLRDRPWVDYLNHQNRMDGGGWGAAIAGNLMMGGKAATPNPDLPWGGPLQIGNQVPVDPGF